MQKGFQMSGGVELAKESKVLEYWRKRYLLQAVVVLVVAVCACDWLLYMVEFSPVLLLGCLLVAFVAYVMVKELRNALQTRGESLVFAKEEELFDDLTFDVGRGICESALLTQEVVQGYQVRECRNVMQGKGFWLEEDWFYTVMSAKYVPLNQTMFEGVVLAFACKKADDGLSAEVYLNANRVVVTGSLEPLLRESGVVETIASLLKIFKGRKAHLNTADKTIYVWIQTEDKLFYQFSLWAPNTMSVFQKRIRLLNDMAKNMVKALNGL